MYILVLLLGYTLWKVMKEERVSGTILPIGISRKFFYLTLTDWTMAVNKALLIQQLCCNLLHIRTLSDKGKATMSKTYSVGSVLHLW